MKIIFYISGDSFSHIVKGSQIYVLRICISLSGEEAAFAALQTGSGELAQKQPPVSFTTLHDDKPSLTALKCHAGRLPLH